MSEAADSVILASASPRRRRLLAWLGIQYALTAVDTAEDLDSPLASDPPALAIALAEEKAQAAAARQAGASSPDVTSGLLILAFDTIVVLGDEVLGKPDDLDDARCMLRALSGQMHDVVTGVAALSQGDSECRTFSVTTPVRMRVLDEKAIESWVAEGELLGCAGAYNIERHLAEVDLDQCFQNVAGLPLCHLYQKLHEWGVAPANVVAPVGTCDLLRGVKCELGPTLTGFGQI
jgi:septum formation protein